jgi:hypothetical protein
MAIGSGKTKVMSLAIAWQYLSSKCKSAKSLSAPSRTRTEDPLIKSQLLYQLS